MLHRAKIPSVKPDKYYTPSNGLILTLVVGLLSFSSTCFGDWQQGSDSLGWNHQGQTVWKFNYQKENGKPYFDIIGQSGVPLTTVKPADHPWHYGLWFSWKYINGVNYWEEDGASGKAAGATRWNEPVIVTKPDGGARIGLRLEYVHPTGRVELTEQRTLEISPVGTNGDFSIDWRAEFKAGTNIVKLDRTPMKGEPHGQVNGGYAGLSLRMAAAPVAVALVTEQGAVTNFVSSRARPEARALAANFSKDNSKLGSIAIVSDAANLPGASPWYAVVNDQMRFFCSAILAPKPLDLKPGEVLVLHYRILKSVKPWTAAVLRKVEIK
jgi:hypothetical protein